MKPGILQMVCAAALVAASSVAAQSPEASRRSEDAATPEAPGAPSAETAPTVATPAETPVEMVADEILVAFDPGSAAAPRDTARNALGAKKIKEFARIGVQHWKLPPGLTVARATELLSQNPNVRFAEPNYIVRRNDLVLPTDDLRGDLWGMHNVGQNGGLAGADINALEAWMDANAQGTGDVVVGVIDSGIDYHHPDLAGRFLPGTNGPGSVLGYDFVNDDADAMDDNGHGTHVAGTIAANADNMVGVIGVAGRNSRVKLVPIKFLSAGGSGTTDAAISAVLYATELQIKITNNSWGGGAHSSALELAIKDSGALFVAAAGNSRSSSLHYPAGYNLPNVLAVAATDARDELASFSNFGEWVHLGAPGTNIVSTTPGNNYSRFNGTSMATPHVAGAAALVLSGSPQLTIAELKANLLNTGDAITSLASGKTSSGKRLNVATALGAAVFIPPNDTPTTVVGLATSPSEATQTSLVLNWPGTAGYLYDLRYRTGGALTDANWSAGIPVYGEPVPPTGGDVLVEGLAPGVDYHFAIRAVSAGGAFSPLAVIQASTLPLGWKSVVVDSGGTVGSYRSLAFRSDGKPVIAYSDETNNRVKVATRAGADGPWTLEAFGSGYGGVSLALIPPGFAGAGLPTVSWASGKLSFATKANGSWAISTVEKSGVQADVTSLAYAPDGTPAISYRSTSSSGGLKIAWRSGTTWKTQVVAAGAAARYSSLGFVNGDPIIAYSDDSDGDNQLDALKVAVGTNRTSNGWSWIPTTLEEGVVGYGVFVSLATSAAGNPYIVHRGAGTLRFLRRSLGSPNGWSAENVGVGSNCSLAIGSDTGNVERAYIAYGRSGRTWIASAPLDGSATWESTIADVEGFSYQSSVKVAAGQPNIAYSVSGDLRLATEAPGYPGPEFLLLDDMESGQNGWTTEGNRQETAAKTRPPGPSNGTGLWHQTILRGNDPGHTPVTSWYYGIEPQKNYDTGTRNWGRLISPEVTLTGGRAELKVSQLVLAEGGTRYENGEIQIREAGGAWTTVLLRASRTNTFFITDKIDLSAYLGKTIQIGFFFDTKDSGFNQFEGWYVDDVSVKLWP